RAARHRRERRSAGAPHRGQGRRAAGAGAGARHAILARSADPGAAVKLLRTIRLDPSDTFVFDRAAEPGEWAVSGAFMFSGIDPATLGGKARAEFRAGLLGVASFGWSTLAQIVEASEQDRAAIVEVLAQQLVAHCGAPGLAEARAAAEEEVAFVSS